MHNNRAERACERAAVPATTPLSAQTCGLPLDLAISMRTACARDELEYSPFSAHFRCLNDGQLICMLFTTDSAEPGLPLFAMNGGCDFVVGMRYGYSVGTVLQGGEGTCVKGWTWLGHSPRVCVTGVLTERPTR